MTKRLCFSYLRFSSPEQAKGDSVRRQMKAAGDYAAQMGWDLNTDLKDEGVSAYRGDNATKGAFGGFLREIEAGRVPRGSILIVENLDRLSRAHPLDAQAQFHVLLKAGIEIVTLTDRRHYTWESVREEPTLLLGSIMVMMRAHEESALKSRRLSDAWANKRARLTANPDKPLTLKAPLWLTWDTATRKWVVIPERVALLQRIYELTANEGVGMAGIAKILNAERVPTFTGRILSEGGAGGWQPGTIGGLLTTRTVLGELHPRVQTTPRKFKPDAKVQAIPDYYPQVIPHALFNKVQAVRAQNDRTGGGRKDGRVGNLFRGKAFCAECGSVTRTRYGKPLANGETYNYYVCSNAERKMGCTNNVYVDIDLIEKVVLDMLYIRKVFWQQTSTNNEAAIAIAEQLAGLEADRARKLKRFETLGEMLADEESTSIRLAYRDLSRELDGWDFRRMELEKQLAEVRGTSSVDDIAAEVHAFLDEAKHPDLAIRLPARNRLMVLMGQLIGRVEINRDRMASVTLADDSMSFDVVKGEGTNICFYTEGLTYLFDKEGATTREIAAPPRPANRWPYRNSRSVD